MDRRQEFSHRFLGFYLEKERGNLEEPTSTERAEAMVRLVRNRDFLILRADGWKRLVDMFVAWLEIDQTTQKGQRDVFDMHYRAQALFGELFRADEMLSDSNKKGGESLG